MPVSQIDASKIQTLAERAYVEQKDEIIEGFKAQLVSSIQTGLAQIESGDVAPFDEDYKNKLRSLIKS